MSRSMKSAAYLLVLLSISTIIVESLAADAVPRPNHPAATEQQLPPMHSRFTAPPKRAIRPAKVVYRGPPAISSRPTNTVYQVGVPLFRHRDIPGLLTPEVVLRSAGIGA
ncbi:hypothetical protein KSP39_PZI003487 [Platanthera zijinensis]|uniref:Secreted protein n=1 Tax=Platanthera zijinensis TaxID=2320716 RepID=A0AAP0BW57_9ASPA